MKTTHIFPIGVIVLIGILVPGCQKQPTACFSYEETGQSSGMFNYEFTNCSTEASSYKWDFGDGGSSSLTAPHHSYTGAGSYTVKLTAFSENRRKTDETSQTITIAGNGKICFWVSGNYPVNLTLQTQGSTVVYPCPSCSPPTDCSGANSFTLPPGSYSYSAQEQSPGTGTWSGTVVITGGDCHLIQF